MILLWPLGLILPNSMKTFSVDTGLLTQNLKVIKWHLCFKFSGSHTMSTARIVPFWELAPLEPQNLKYGYRKHIFAYWEWWLPTESPKNDGEEATPNFIPLLPEYSLRSFFACFTEGLIQNAAITIKVLFPVITQQCFILLSRIVF